MIDIICDFVIKLYCYFVIDCEPLFYNGWVYEIWNFGVLW
jgi:hypothetical protein